MEALAGLLGPKTRPRSIFDRISGPSWVSSWTLFGASAALGRLKVCEVWRRMRFNRRFGTEYKKVDFSSPSNRCQYGQSIVNSTTNLCFHLSRNMAFIVVLELQLAVIFGVCGLNSPS